MTNTYPGLLHVTKLLFYSYQHVIHLISSLLPPYPMDYFEANSRYYFTFKYFSICDRFAKYGPKSFNSPNRLPLQCDKVGFPPIQSGGKFFPIS